MCGSDRVSQLYRQLIGRFDQAELCVWAFDLLKLGREDLRL